VRTEYKNIERQRITARAPDFHLYVRLR